jgi:DNA polymerase-3 subunit theta
LSKWNIASFSKDEQDKVSVDKAAAAVAWQERMNKPVVHELVEREQPEHLREYFRERLRIAEQSAAARANAPEYQKPEDGGSESKP